MRRSILRAEELRRILAIRDLTDPATGPHALQLLLDELCECLRCSWGCEVVVHRAHPVIPVAENYDRLRYPAEGAARDARYTRYVDDRRLLRTHSSAMIPPLLEQLAVGAACPQDVLLVCPGLVYRRDSIDRLHTGEPHQVDLWRIRRGPALATGDLGDMIERVVASLLPGRVHRCSDSPHPYTTGGLQIDVAEKESWVEIGECGLAHPAVLEGAGLDPGCSTGLAMGLGLDRILMLRKGIDDIRLLRSTDPRVCEQMLDLRPYHPVSSQPAVQRDLSIAVAADTTSEDLGDRVRSALGACAPQVESVEVLSETPHADLPASARRRLGIRPGQKNLLLRVMLRDLERTLTNAEANRLRDRVYAALHEGEAQEWARDAGV